MTPAYSSVTNHPAFSERDLVPAGIKHWQPNRQNTSASKPTQTTKPSDMKSKPFLKQIILAGCALLAFTLTARAQITFADFGPTAPTPGLNDIYQVNTNGDSAPAPGGANYFDNNSGTGTGASGQTFITGPNALGYVMTNLFIKFGFTGLNLPNTSFVGGNDVDGASQGWTIQIFQLNDPTGKAPISPTSSHWSSAIRPPSPPTHNPVDWFQFSGMVVPLAPNTVYAYTIVCTQNRSSSYAALDFGTNTTVIGSSNGVGAICRIAATAATTPAPVTYFPDRR